MPPQLFKSNVAEIRLNNIIVSLKPVVTLLNEITDAFGTSFVPAIANTTSSLITLLQNVKKNKNECIQLMETVHVLLHAIVDTHIKSEIAGNLPPETLEHVAEFSGIVHKIHIFVQAQQEGNKIKHFFRQSEMNTLLKECQAGLQQALNMFKVHNNMIMSRDVAEMQKSTEEMHRKLLDLISTLSERTDSEESSSIHIQNNNSWSSFNSISMLPAKPKIFHGRELELNEIVQAIRQASARIAILGAGGMGKTSLAKAVLHYPDVVDRYPTRFFVASDSATTSVELAALIGLHLGLKPATDLTKSVVHYFFTNEPCLLVLDNLETAWEPIESHSKIEEFLSLLTSITHLTLIVTMRGAERPAKVQWTRPFLVPLMPLSTEAAHHIFIDIAEDHHNTEEISQILSLTDNLPLAVDLMAHLVYSEGCSNVLVCWETEKTAMLSNGDDRQSNLDVSISISLSSPRMSIGARNLLSLLSILPDGLSDIELLQCNLSIENVLTCKAALLRTSLAYTDEKRQLKSLVPIREHMQCFYPPSSSLTYQLQTYFCSLLNLYQKHSGIELKHVIDQISSNLGNLHQLLLRGLDVRDPNLRDAINNTIALNSFSRMTGCGWHSLMDHIPVLPAACDNTLETAFATEVLISHQYYAIPEAEQLISKTASQLCHVKDTAIKIRFYMAVGDYYMSYLQKKSVGMQFLDKALTLGKACGNHSLEASILYRRGLRYWNIGNYLEARNQSYDAQRLATLSGDLLGEARALKLEAMCLTHLGDYPASITQNHRARKLLDLCGMSGGNWHRSMLSSEAEIYLLKSEYAEARRIYCQIVQSTSAHQDLINYAFSLLNLADIDIMTGATKQDVHHNLDKAKAIFSTVEYSEEFNYCKMVSANMELREQETQMARSLFQSCLTVFWGGINQGVSYCLERLADVSLWGMSEYGWVSRWTFIYLAHAKKIQSKVALHKALQFIGDVFSSNGDKATAYSIFTVALEGFTYMDIHRNRAQCMLRMGDISKEKGDLVKAVEFWKDAWPLFERSLQQQNMVQVDSRLHAAKEM